MRSAERGGKPWVFVLQGTAIRPYDGSLTSSFIPAGRLVGAGRSAHTSAGASSIVVTAYMVRVSMSCGICTIPI